MEDLLYDVPVQPGDNIYLERMLIIFPIVEGYRAGATSNSPSYSTVAYRTADNFSIANSLIFSNLINQFINKVHYYGINKTP